MSAAQSGLRTSQKMEQSMFQIQAAAALTAVVTIAGCTTGGHATTVVSSHPAAPTASDPAPETPGTSGGGVVAKPSSTAFPLEGRDIRVVRVGEGDVALQFELFNGTTETVEPYDIGMGLIERDFKLVDMPRATAYDVQKNTGFDGRVSDNQYEKIAPGSATTITAVFTAPPPDATKLWFMTDVLQPVEVPIQPAGSAALIGDPVLTSRRDDGTYVNTLMCSSEGAQGEGSDTPVEIKLPSDVLFEFGKSELTPAAQAAIDEVAGQIGSASGTITIEGHTDAVGDDPSNQLLSEARAQSVEAALQDRLGSESTFNAVGFGETRPVAANTNPDGSDNPDGRAQNRRVEIRTGDMTAAGPPQLDARPLADDLAAQGATAQVDSVQRVGGHLLTTVNLTNPTSTAIEVPQDSGLTDPIDRATGITVADGVRMLRSSVCTTGGELLEGFSILAGPPSGQFESTGSHLLLPGESVHLWGFYAAPPADVTTVDVEIGGLAMVAPTPITG
jgi:outer membrane protein OmpA-like peptidoglycan-associated protein